MRAVADLRINRFNEQDMCWYIYVSFGLWLDGFKLFWGADYSIVNRLKKVLFPFWFIVVLAAPFLLLYDDISWYDVVTDSLLLTSKMNGSWWFMQTYVIFVICFPIFAKSLHYKMVCIPLLIASVLCFQPIATDIRKYSDVCIMFCIIFLFFTLV